VPGKIKPELILALFLVITMGVGGYFTYRSLNRDQSPAGLDGDATTPAGPSPRQPVLTTDVEQLPDLVAAQRRA